MTRPMTKVLMALSGGVDSSVAAALLVERGVPVVGVTLHLWDAEGNAKVGRCCAPEDREDARRTADQLGIPYFVFDERDAFRREVVAPFIEEYQTGRTPSPCVHCNKTVKLAWLVSLADELGCSHVATGHYARVVDTLDGPRLFRGHDRDKDQSYFLFGLPREVLGRLVFPLGEWDKARTRVEGERLRVPNARKPDSQELCFIPDGDVAGFVAKQAGARPGAIIDDSGRVLGQHEGIAGFTVGKRRGLALGGGDKPRYVLRLVPETADVVVGDASDLYSRDALIVEPTFFTEPGSEAFTAEVQVRYRHRAARARLQRQGSVVRIRFDEPQRALAPGQAAVIYRDDEVLGGGFLSLPTGDAARD